MRLGYLMVLFVIGLLSGCATTHAGAVTMTCSTLGSSQLTSGGNRIDLRHFSVQLPGDANVWCVGRPTRGQLSLYTHPLMGQHIEKPEPHMAVNILALSALEIDHGTAQLETTIALQNFVEAWIDRGLGVDSTGTEMIVMRRHAQNITVNRSKVTPDPRPQAHCVRYEYQIEERDNPLVPNSTLVQDTYGLICQHPRIPSNIVMMALSEQYTEGNQIDTGLFPQMKRDAAQPFFDSLEFSSADDISQSTGEDVGITGIPVSEKGYELKFRGFSIELPTDDRWQLISDNQKSHIATFSFTPLSPTHSFNATVQIRGLPKDFETKQEFKDFIDTKLREHSSRFDELSFRSTLTELSGEWAVTYELRYLDKNPENSSIPLIMTIKGFMYLHPYWKKSVIDASYSERGTEAELDGTLDPAGQELIDGVSPEKS